MNMDIHRVSNIQVKRFEYETFQTVRVSVFTKDGEEHQLTMFTDDRLELEKKDD
tara:strand:+ start:3054 stop:3215 length:162 start_codon:yes stop_codon:yes gene_type:complete